MAEDKIVEDVADDHLSMSPIARIRGHRTLSCARLTLQPAHGPTSRLTLGPVDRLVAANARRSLRLVRTAARSRGPSRAASLVIRSFAGADGLA
jgi:hypothetical protein